MGHGLAVANVINQLQSLIDELPRDVVRPLLTAEPQLVQAYWRYDDDPCLHVVFALMNQAAFEGLQRRTEEISAEPGLGQQTEAQILRFVLTGVTGEREIMASLANAFLVDLGTPLMFNVAEWDEEGVHAIFVVGGVASASRNSDGPTRLDERTWLAVDRFVAQLQPLIPVS